eukprot:g13017.t1
MTNATTGYGPAVSSKPNIRRVFICAHQVRGRADGPLFVQAASSVARKYTNMRYRLREDKGPLLLKRTDSNSLDLMKEVRIAVFFKEITVQSGILILVLVRSLAGISGKSIKG